MTASHPLFVKSTGTGRPLIFLHGFLEDHSIWNSIYPDFVNDGFRCVLIDLPCHGRSRFEGEVCTMGYMAARVAEYIRENDIQNPHLLGHSMGGYVGLELLRLIPAKLTLIHSNFWADPETKKTDRNRVIEVVKKNKRLFLNEAIPNLFAPYNREFRREQIDALIEKASRTEVTEIAAATAGMRDRFPAYDIMDLYPVNIIQGSDDPIIPDGILEHELAKLNTKPVIYRIENCGHMSFIEQPSALINHLKTILFQ